MLFEPLDAPAFQSFDIPGRMEIVREFDARYPLRPSDTVDRHARIGPDPGPEPPELSDEAYLVFSSNNYLGLATDDRVADAAADAARSVGTGAVGSRIVTGDTTLHRELERSLAETKRAERAVAFSSGYATNVGTITGLFPQVIFSDELNHTSIIEGCRMSTADVIDYDHCDPADLAAKMAAEYEARGSTDGWLIVTDTVFSMDGTVAPLTELCDVADEYDAWVMVDEAHATGLYEDGGGIVQAAGLSDRIEIQMGTLSKALASQGGYVAGDDDVMTYIANAARSFLFSTGLNPPAAAAAKRSLELSKSTDRRQQLWENVAHLRDGLEALGYDVRGDSQILPVMVGDEADARALESRLRDRGIVVHSITYPGVPKGEARMRLIATAGHTRSELDRCVEGFAEAGAELGLCE